MSHITKLLLRDEFEVAVDRLCLDATIRRSDEATRRAARLHSLCDNQLFGIIRQQWQPDGQQHRALVIAQAVGRDVSLLFELPGASRPVMVHAMVDQIGPAGSGGAVDRLLSWIEFLRESGIDPLDLPSTYWRDVSYWVMLRQRPPMPPRRAA